MEIKEHYFEVGFQEQCFISYWTTKVVMIN
jgi:hypothetical protein